MIGIAAAGFAAHDQDLPPRWRIRPRSSRKNVEWAPENQHDNSTGGCFQK